EMNIRPATVVAMDGGLGIDLGGVVLKLPAAFAEKLQGKVGGNALFGIRPEHIGTPASVRRPDMANTAEIATGTFRIREHMGNEVYT
ncbi:hypothetical protein J8J40_30610, partial [Mycobacterium tuberculosis]|nr:hypothetical protein [Mycobacterium tuberculosis]